MQKLYGLLFLCFSIVIFGLFYVNAQFNGWDVRCPNLASNYPTCTITQNGACMNNAINPPQCNNFSTGGTWAMFCYNGAINPPSCTTSQRGFCINTGANNPPMCTVRRNWNCINEALNPPICDVFTGNVGTGWTGNFCQNGAVNYPACTINANWSCVNNAINPPSCTIFWTGGTGFVWTGGTGVVCNDCVKTAFLNKENAVRNLYAQWSLQVQQALLTRSNSLSYMCMTGYSLQANLTGSEIAFKQTMMNLKTNYQNQLRTIYNTFNTSIRNCSGLSNQEKNDLLINSNSRRSMDMKLFSQNFSLSWGVLGTWVIPLWSGLCSNCFAPAFIAKENNVRTLFANRSNQVLASLQNRSNTINNSCMGNILDYLRLSQTQFQRDMISLRNSYQQSLRDIYTNFRNAILACPWLTLQQRNTFLSIVNVRRSMDLQLFRF